MSEHFAELDRELEQAKHWSKAEVALAIEQYVFKLEHSSDDQEDLLRKLELQPEKTQSVALELLGDPALQTRLRREPRGEPALYRACQLLLLQPTEAAVPHLQRLLAADQEAVRQDAYKWLAMTGDIAAAGDLTAGLNDADEGIAAAIVTGLQQASYATQGDLARSLFAPIAELLANQPQPCTETAAEILLRWDQPKALAHLEEHDLLTPGRAGFAAAMTALLKSGVLLPRERLLSLIDEMDLPLTTERDGTALLTMLALHKHEDDQSALIDYMDYPGPLAAAAATAMLTMHDVADWLATILDESRSARGDTEQRAYAVWMLDNDLQNGGFHHYFSNPSCGHWRAALAGLRSCHDDERADLLEEALQALPEPPSRDPARQQIPLAADSGAAFTELDDRYYALRRPVQVSLTRIILSNVAAFRS